MPASLKIVAVALGAMVAGTSVGGFVACSDKSEPRSQADHARERNDLLTGYDLLWSTLEDESQVDKLGLFKKVTLDAPPEKILAIMEQVSKAATNTLEELERFRSLEPEITPLPQQDDFGTKFKEAMQDDGTKLLLERSPKFSKRLIVSQAQALRAVIVLSKQIAKIDPNEQRREWLERVSGDYTKMYDAYLAHLAFTGANE